MSLGNILGAVGGGTLGGLFGGPMGALAGAGIGGGLGGLFGGNDLPNAPSLSDVNLERDAPELYKRLKEQDAQVQEALRLYNERRSGPTAQEQRQISQQDSGTQSQLNNQGMLGSSDGYLVAANAHQNALDAVRDRAFREQQSLLQGVQGAQQGLYQNTLGAYGAVLNPMNMNYQAAINNGNSQNQFNSGLLGGGASLLGNYLNTQQLASAYGNSGGYGNYGGYQNAMNPGWNLSNQIGFGGGNSLNPGYRIGP